MCYHADNKRGGGTLPFDFTVRVSREGAGTLKGAFTPDAVRDAGLVTFWGAEFEFPTCPAFSRGVRKCAERGLYAFTLQTEDYNRHVAWWMKNMRNMSVENEWIVPVHGTIFGLASAIRIFLLPEKKRLLVIHPGYNRYAQAAARMGLESVASCMVFRDGTYSIDWQDLERKMADPRNGLLVFSNPNNPTGRILRRDELEKIALLSNTYHVPVFCDEIFAEVTRGETVTSYATIPEGQAYAITATSLGKCMSLTGVNHANLLIPSPSLRDTYIRQKYADHYGSIDPMLYAGLLEAYSEEGADFVRALNRVIDQNTAYFEKQLPESIPGARVIHPEGTFVIFVDYSPLGLEDDVLAEKLQDRCLFYGDDGGDYGVSRQFYRYNLAVPPQCLCDSFSLIRQNWDRK